MEGNIIVGEARATNNMSRNNMSGAEWEGTTILADHNILDHNIIKGPKRGTSFGTENNIVGKNIVGS